MTAAAVTRALVVDTAAAVAIILDEVGSNELSARLEQAPARLMSAVTRVELGLVIEARLGPAGAEVVRRFLRDAQIELVGVDVEMADRALGGWRRYGKGRHRAALNFGDAFVYALVEAVGYPLLCAGADFAATDLEVIRPGDAPD